MCDKMLDKLVCYISSTLHLRAYGWVGDDASQLALGLFADADFAGDKQDMKSTSGVFMTLTGPSTACPLNGISKKQTGVSHSTPEAEIVAADLAVRTEGFPALQLWETLLGRPIDLHFHEDNKAAIQIITTGKNPTIRHMGRTHEVDLAWPHQEK